jgi:hypothetical protein
MRQVSPTQKEITVCPIAGTVIATPQVGETVAVVGITDYFCLRTERDKWQRRAEKAEVQRAHAYGDLDYARKCGEEAIKAKVREVLEETDRSYRESNVAPGQRSVALIHNLRAIVGEADAPEVPETEEAEGPVLRVDGVHAWLEDRPPDKRQAAREVLSMIRDLLMEVVPPPQVGGHAPEEAREHED